MKRKIILKAQPPQKFINYKKRTRAQLVSKAQYDCMNRFGASEKAKLVNQEFSR